MAQFCGQLPEWLKQPHVRKAIVLDESTNAGTVQQVLTHGYASDLTDVESRRSGKTRS